MKMRQISAASIKDAMNIARRELGEEAVLIDSKKAGNGGIVVTFAVDEPDEVLFNDFNEQPADILPFVPEAPKAAPAAKIALSHPAQEVILEALDYHGLPTGLRDQVMAHIARQKMKPDALLDAAEAALAKALEEVMVFKPIETVAKVPPARALMLIGPHGAGKTSTIAKLATELTLHKKPIVLISTDTERLGGVDALHTLGGLLKCEVVVSETRAHLKGLLAKLQGKAWLLIDSSGANIYEFKQLKALGEFASLQGVEPILTCPAGMDRQEAEEMAGVFQFLNLERMIVTRLDAVRRLGSLFATLTAGGYALADLTNSAIPTDSCQPASAAGLSRLMLRHVRERLTH